MWLCNDVCYCVSVLIYVWPPYATVVSLNRFCTEQGQCGACRRKWRLKDTDLCPCGETQMMSHIVESCPLTKLNGSLSRLHSADEDVVSWLTSYGSWNAYEKKKNVYYHEVVIGKCLQLPLWNFQNGRELVLGSCCLVCQVAAPCNEASGEICCAWFLLVLISVYLYWRQSDHFSEVKAAHYYRGSSLLNWAWSPLWLHKSGRASIVIWCFKNWVGECIF